VADLTHEESFSISSSSLADFKETRHKTPVQVLAHVEVLALEFPKEAEADDEPQEWANLLPFYRASFPRLRALCLVAVPLRGLDRLLEALTCAPGLKPEAIEVRADGFEDGRMYSKTVHVHLRPGESESMEGSICDHLASEVKWFQE
jgi:hypothetical protein